MATPIDRAALLAQTYQIPQQQPQQLQQSAGSSQQPFVDEVGDPMTDLEQVDGATSDYFNKWSQLKGFAREVQSTMGLDVRFPDPSVPESERLHRIYLKALADLKNQGERLKTGQKMKVADRARGSIVNQAPGQYYDELNVGTDIVDTKLDPIVEAANSKLSQFFYGNSITEAQKFYDDTKAQLEARRDKNPNQAGYWQRQIDSLVTPSKGIKEFAPPRDPADNVNIKAAGVHLDKVANMMLGTANGYTLSDTAFGPNGERVYVNKDMTNIKYGDKLITEWQHTPSTGETVIIAGGQRIPLTGQDVVTVAKTISSDNPRFDIDGKYINMYADEKGYFGETGEVNPSALVSDDIIERVTAARLAEEANEDSVSTDNAAKKLDEEISKLVPHKEKSFINFWNDSFDGVTQDGKPVEVTVKGDSNGNRIYDIDNIDDLIGRVDSKGKKRDLSIYKNMSKTHLKKFLTGLGVHFQFKETPQEVAAKKKTVTKPTGTDVAPNPAQVPNSVPPNREDLL